MAQPEQLLNEIGECAREINELIAPMEKRGVPIQVITMALSHLVGRRLDTLMATSVYSEEHVRTVLEYINDMALLTKRMREQGPRCSRAPRRSHRE
jgi:hypothetical protein